MSQETSLNKTLSSSSLPSFYEMTASVTETPGRKQVLDHTVGVMWDYKLRYTQGLQNKGDISSRVCTADLPLCLPLYACMLASFIVNSRSKENHKLDSNAKWCCPNGRECFRLIFISHAICQDLSIMEMPRYINSCMSARRNLDD